VEKPVGGGTTTKTLRETGWVTEGEDATIAAGRDTTARFGEVLRMQALAIESWMFSYSFQKLDFLPRMRVLLCPITRPNG
jgi:hypothetical protein